MFRIALGWAIIGLALWLFSGAAHAEVTATVGLGKKVMDKKLR